MAKFNDRYDEKNSTSICLRLKYVKDVMDLNHAHDTLLPIL
ncbi:hypothetical protein BN1088_460002 [Sphingobacterium sp. PM2-P1-29]|nr:hypothetical protein BN1088_460002 [Sphingobacterium sp. PM2-P1-29]